MRTNGKCGRSSLLRTAVAGLLPLAAACQPAPETDGEENEAAGPVVNLPSGPIAAAPMDRAALLLAIGEAASAMSTGSDDSAAQRSLDGRQIELRIRFGCRGPAPELGEATLGWARDADNGALRLRATPTIDRDSEIVSAIVSENIEAVEGFWIPRPWILSPACPARQAVPAPPEPAGDKADAPGNAAGAAQDTIAEVEGVDDQETMIPPPAYPRVGIAEFYTSADPRTHRRANRPYEAVKNLRPDEAAGDQGFNLVLSGRLRAIPGKGVIHCVASGPDSPPDCIVSADIDRVWIEQPGVRAPLAEWAGS